MATAQALRQRVAHHLNAYDYTVFGTNPTANTADGKPWFHDTQIDWAVQDAAAAVLTVIAANPMHPRRSGLMAPVVITNPGDLLPAHVGPIGAVRIGGTAGPPEANRRLATLTAVDDVQRMADDVLGLSVGDYYGLDAERIYWVPVADDCVVDMVQIASPPDVTTVPDDFIEAVICYATAVMMAFDGSKVEGANHYKGLAEGFLNMVSQNIPIPETPVYAP
jgi:hypothetical protein